MKLQPLLFDASAMYGHPGLAMPTWGQWSQPITAAPVSRQPYQRLREYTVPEVSQEISADFWEPVVPNSILDSNEISRTSDDHRSRPRSGVEHSIPIKIEHLTTGRSRMSGMYDDRVCEYNQTSDYDDYHQDRSQRGSHVSPLDDDRTNSNSNANGERLKTNEYTRRTRSSDESERTLRSRSDLYNRTSRYGSRPSDRYVASDIEARPERSREDLICTGLQRPYESSSKCDYEDIDAQIAASYGYDMGKEENDVELKVDLPKSPGSSTPILSKLRTLRSSNMYIILDNEEEEEVRSYKKTNPSLKKSDNLSGILNSRGEFYDLCDEDCECQKLVVNLPPPKAKVTTPTKESSETPKENLAKTPSDNRNISAPPSYPAYKIIRKVISSFGGIVDYIRGDGNCFFRALSKVIYGVESCHGEIRQAMVDIMEKFPKDFEQFIDNRSIEDHFQEMRKDGVWATQAEIYGAASFLQRDIYILSPDHTGDEYRWLLFSPRLKCSKVDSYHTCHVTLCHTNGNHYDRIAPATGECNCGVAPPILNGTNLQVDLTSGTEEVV
ncbi:uncharacterized protein LOC110453458 [Mizuhopecten yessoensis]|uniref:uncharacterized protein LOC110453458 n=1 Tax=Mizuhopecten yessoensis TaxID=6573 RepID=UPI000B4595B1|nr:uncharacterized protein LOC110453458 [Mizuhopecten yessoensis]